MRQKCAYKPFVVSPSTPQPFILLSVSKPVVSLVEPEMAGVLRTGPLRRNVLKTLTIRPAQGERNL